MSELLSRMARRARRALGWPRGPLSHSWRTIEAGPLAGVQLYLPSDNEAPWSRRVVLGQYEPETLAALAELAGTGGVLYDIGAHTGYYTCAWLRLGGAHVEAFEPTPYNRRLLQATVQRNGMGAQVRIHETALGDIEGHAT